MVWTRSAWFRSPRWTWCCWTFRMPRMDGIETTRRLAALSHPPKILVLTTFDLDEYAFTALRAGASGFLLKDVPTSDLVRAIHAVYHGDAVVAPSQLDVCWTGSCRSCL